MHLPLDVNDSTLSGQGMPDGQASSQFVALHEEFVLTAGVPWTIENYFLWSAAKFPGLRLRTLIHQMWH